MTKRVLLLGVISAMLLAGCGKSAGTQVARPIALGSTVKPSATTALTRITPAPTPTPDLEAEFDEEETAGDEETTEETASASPTPSPTPSATPTATPTPRPTATPTPDVDEDDEEEVVTVPGNAFVKSIGNGSLNSSNGLAVAGDFIYVVDNARTGLFGKFASVRQYDIETGAYTKLSFENIAMMGAKNMPTTVTSVKIDTGLIIAASPTATYTFGLDGKLVSTEEGTFAITTQVKDPKTGDTFKLNGSQIDRIHGGKVIVSFGDNVIGEANAIAVGADGTLFVSDKTKGIVHQFAPAK